MFYSSLSVVERRLVKMERNFEQQLLDVEIYRSVLKIWGLRIAPEIW